MAAHSLSIAKASLLASCLRPDCTKLTRDELNDFHNVLEVTLIQCTPTNIQKTKTWLLQHILPSAPRTAAFSKYVSALSKNSTGLPESIAQVRPCRQRLHILYLLHDVFHHAKYHVTSGPVSADVQKHLLAALPDLFAYAVENERARTSKRLRELLRLWESKRLCDPATIAVLQKVLTSGKAAASATERTAEVKTTKELPWIMPATHGDPSAPFFDLPAANLMPHIVPNSSNPMRPDRIRALQLSAGPADASLVQAVKDFLNDVKSIEDPCAAHEDEGIVADFDEMGQMSHKNDAEDTVGDTYYGWSRAFCEKMKNRAKANGDDRRSRSRSRSSSRSRSRSLSRSLRKRRRYSSSRSRSRSAYRSRSPQRYGSVGHKQRPQRFGQPQSFSSAPAQSLNHPPPPPVQPDLPTGHPYPPPPPPGIAEGVIPPRPPNWQGPWPPPPPPPGSLPFPPMPRQHFNYQGFGRR